MYIHIYMYIHTYTYVHVHSSIYSKRERETEKGKKRDSAWRSRAMSSLEYSAVSLA